MKTMLKILKLTVPAGIAVFFAVISGCGTTDPVTPVLVNNPNVKVSDYIEVFEDSAAFVTHTGINLLGGVNTVDSSSLRDCSLNDLNNSGVDFFLQNGQLDKLLPGGFEIRFFRVDPNMTSVAFDTLPKIQGYDTLRSIDFTQDNTYGGSPSAPWGYFNAPLSSTPVYCFWLKGKQSAGITALPVYGIIQPIEATDRNPGAVYGYRMSFKVRINIKGENDFRKQILQ